MVSQMEHLLPKYHDQKPVIIKVMTYNVLADAYTKGTSLTNYPGKDLAVLQDFNFRAKRVIREISQQMDSCGLPEIICFQEVDNYNEFYKKELELLGYDTEVAYRRNIDAELIGW